MFAPPAVSSPAGTLRSSWTWRRRPGSPCSSTAGIHTWTSSVGLCIFTIQFERRVFAITSFICVCVCVRDHEEEQGPMCRRSGEQVPTVISDVFQCFCPTFCSHTTQRNAFSASWKIKSSRHLYICPARFTRLTGVQKMRLPSWTSIFTSGSTAGEKICASPRDQIFTSNHRRRSAGILPVCFFLAL